MVPYPGLGTCRAATGLGSLGYLGFRAWGLGGLGSRADELFRA